MRSNVSRRTYRRWLLLAAGTVCACGGGGSGDTAAPTGPEPPAAVTGLRCSGPDGRGWCWQAPQPWGHLVRDVAFVSALEGLAVGDGGLVLHTSDGGRRWTERTLPGAPTLQALAFAPNGRQAWLLGRDGGRLWRSTDAGASWQEAPPLPLPHAMSLERAANGTLVLRGDTEAAALGFQVRISDDGGSRWRDPGTGLLVVDADGAQWHEVFGRGVLRSTDGGQTFGRPAGWPADYSAVQLSLAPDGYAWARLFASDPQQLPFVRHAARPGAQAPWTELALPEGFFSALWFAADGGWAWGSAGATPAPRLWHAEAPGQPWTERALPDADDNSWGFTFVDGLSAWTRESLPSLATWITTDGARSWVRTAAFGAQGRNNPSALQRDGGGGLLLAADGHPRTYGTPAAWFRSLDGGRSWVTLPGAREPADPFTALWMVDGRRGLALTASGRMLETDDGGQHWQAGTAALQHPERFSARADLQFTADGSGWLLDDNRLRRTRDGGRSWTELPSPAPTAELRRLQFVDDRTGFLVSGSFCGTPHLPFPCDQRLWVTEDQGQTWVATGPSWSGDTRLHMIDRLRGVRVVGDQAQHTRDGGLSWAAAAGAAPLPAQPLQRIASGAGALWLLYGDALRRSVDDGRSWSEVALPVPPVWVPPLSGSGLAALRDIAFADDRQGWIVGVDGWVLASLDAGLSWQRQASGTGLDFERVFARHTRAVWIATAYGGILASASGGR